MISNFEIPSYAEDFDEIKIIQNYATQYDYSDAYLEMQGFDQKNPHHALDLMRHCEKCQDYVLQQNDIFDVIPEIAMAALLHDYGKLFTASWDEDKSCNHYYNHENVGAYDFLCYADNNLFSRQMIQDIALLINLHMIPHQWRDQNKKNKIQQIYGEHIWKVLMWLNKADMAAH